MKLVCLLEDFIGAFLLTEGYGKTQTFDYGNWKTDPTPQVLQLGTWVHPSTGNPLVGGINLNYLAPDEVEQLRYYLPEILKNKGLKRRYWTGVRLLPQVFKQFYRTYNQNNIQTVTPGTLSFMTNKELQNKGEQEKAAKLQTRRDQMQAQPKPEQVIPPEPEDQIVSVDDELADMGAADPKTSDQKGKEATRIQRQDRMSQRIDQRTRGLQKQQQVPPPVKPIPGQMEPLTGKQPPGQDSAGAPFGEAPLEEPPIPPTIEPEELEPDEEDFL